MFNFKHKYVFKFHKRILDKINSTNNDMRYIVIRNSLITHQIFYICDKYNIEIIKLELHNFNQCEIKLKCTYKQYSIFKNYIMSTLGDYIEDVYLE